MNAGIFGLPNGTSAQRKLLGRVGRVANPLTLTTSATLAANAGAAYISQAVSAGVRTRLVSVSGRGALRFCLLHNGQGSDQTLTYEIILDGVTLISGSQLVVNGQGGILIGGGSTAMLDYAPFDSSCEFFASSTASTATLNYSALIDLHQ